MTTFTRGRFGICSCCERSIRVTKDNTIGWHRQRGVFVDDTSLHMMWPQPACDGWGLLPKETTA